MSKTDEMSQKAREAARRPSKRSPYKKRIVGIAVHRERWQALVNAVASAFNDGIVVGGDRECVSWAVKKVKEVGATFNNMSELVSIADTDATEAKSALGLSIAREALYVNGLEKAIEKFREYERLHRVKETAEGRLKANANADMAEELEKLLQQQRQQPEFYEVVKSCLTVLCVVRDEQSWSLNMLRDIDFAIEGCRETIKKYRS